MFFDKIAIGSEAEKIASIGAIKEISAFRNSRENIVNILDLVNTQSIEVTGGHSATANINISPIRNEYASLSFDAAENFVGIDTIFIEAIGSEGYFPNTIKVPIIIEDNKPPYIGDVLNQNILVGDTSCIQLEDINDGNLTTTQSLIIYA